jgi:hypothetical protein
MLVYVKKEDLVNDPVPVVAYYPDNTVGLTIDVYGSICTMFRVPDTEIDLGTMPPRLKIGFRSAMATIVNTEAARRITVPFPVFMQQNCNNDIGASTLKYGLDVDQWPIDAQERKNENDRGWTYIVQIRQTADALATQTTLTDPTDDSHWPPMITPVYISLPGA